MEVENWDQPKYVGQPVFPCTGFGIANFHTIGVLKLDYVTSPEEADDPRATEQTVHLSLGSARIREMAQQLLHLADHLDRVQSATRQ